MAIDLGLEGKRALVTGAGIGIGRGIATWLARAGCDVVLADKDAASLDEAVAEVAGAGTRVIGLEADLRRPDAVRGLVDPGGRRRSAASTSRSTTWVRSPGGRRTSSSISTTRHCATSSSRTCS